MSQSDQIKSPTTGAVPSWSKMIPLTLGMTLLGGSAGLILPFAADVITWGPGPHGLSLIGLACALPMLAVGARLSVSSLGMKMIA